MCECYKLHVPDTNIDIANDSYVKLGRFDATIWIIKHGWYQCDGNRPHCGWYFQQKDDPAMIKPVSLSDLYDIYEIQL